MPSSQRPPFSTSRSDKQPEPQDQDYRERVQAARCEYEMGCLNAKSSGVPQEEITLFESIFAKYLDKKYDLRPKDSICNATQKGDLQPFNEH